MPKFDQKAGKAPGGAADKAEIPDVERHDEIYFRHTGGAGVGRVLSRGEHGCVVDEGGKRHKVRWADIHGHKVKVRPEVKVVDQGEDGMLVEDRAGRRRFVADPLGPADEPGVRPMAKSLTPVVLFTLTTPGELVKAFGVKGRAGLSLQATLDKGGKQTRRWKKTSPDEKSDRKDGAGEGEEMTKHGLHNVKKGDRVSFKMGTVEGNGQVVAAGEKGATVKDAEGHPHKVTWDQIADHTVGGREDHAEAPEDAAKGAAPTDLFEGVEVGSLPALAVQPASSWDELSAKATEALAQYQEALGSVAEMLGLNASARPGDLEEDHLDSDEGFLFVGKLKSEARAKEKAESDYGGDYSQLRDVVRATIAVSSMADVKAAIGAVTKSGLELAQQPKNRFEKPTAEGYRDLLTIVKLPNGMLAELQYHLKPVTAAKAKGHADYGITRTLQAKYGEGEPTETWSDEDHSAFYDAMKRQQAVYGEAWKKATAGA